VYDSAAALLAADAIRRPGFRPRWGLVLGSGFGDLVAALADSVAVPFSAIPGMPIATVTGHRGVLHQGMLDQTPVAILEGRLHGYEGYDVAATTFPIRILAALGVGALFLTNAAGGLDPQLDAGSLMLISDHLNITALAGNNPLRGGPDGDLPRFVAMRDAYSPALRAQARQSARRLGIKLHEGVYAMVAGPSYETPAELQFLRRCGADAVGMSTTNEVIVARQLGLEVLGLSCIANAAHGTEEGIVQHSDVLAAVHRQAPNVLRFFRDLLAHT
jgi:purine-nucleoside phosphorylase